MRKFDPSKPVVTRDGRDARIVVTDGNGLNGRFPVLALVTERDGYEMALWYESDGKVAHLGAGEHPLDLLNVVEKSSRFYNIWKSEKAAGYPHPTISKCRIASLATLNAPLAIIEVLLEDGVPVGSIIHPAEA